MTELNDNNYSTEISHGKSAVLFWADWCSYCTPMKTCLSEIDVVSSENGNTHMKIYICNVEDSPKVANDNNLMSLPTIVLFNQGKEYNRLLGSQNPAALREIILEN